MTSLNPLWVYLAASPLLGLTLTLCGYGIAHWIYTRCKFSPFANPVAIAIALISAALAAIGMSYRDYFAGAQFVHFLLGPATVALAIPLARQMPRFRRFALPLALGLAAGCVVAMVSAVGIVMLMDGGAQMAASIGPKSATSPIAMAISERMGGIPSLTAVLVISTGIFGSISARYWFDLLRIDSDEARGFALGVTSHGIGTARAFQISPQMGAFAGLGMGVNAILTALIAPWLLPRLIDWFG